MVTAQAQQAQRAQQHTQQHTQQHCVTQPTPPFEIGPTLTLEGGAAWRARVHQVPAARDNLCWLIEYAPKRVALVDGPGASEVTSYLATHQLTLTHVLNTHTHGDHIGVNRALISRGEMEGVEVWASASAPVEVPGLTRALHDGEELSLGELKGFVWLTEGHLNGHISFVWGAQQEGLQQEELNEEKGRAEGGSPALFCGDTLFTGGCGYVFDGPMSTMASSLERLASLPPSTWVCCAHEYTLDNLHFALSVEPHNEALRARALRVSALREAGGCAVPSRLSEELESNPFLRATLNTLRPTPSQAELGEASERAEERFERVRRLKDSRAYREQPFSELLSRG